MIASAVVLAGLAVGAAFAAGPFAKATLADCDRTMCMWGNNDFNWQIGDRWAGGGWRNLGSVQNDQMDSWHNKSATYPGCMANHANGGGERQTMHTQSQDNNVNVWNSDEVSSWRTQNGC